ncbi:hypothetical protein QVD17_18815 [Tagetes erecta]|uniref:RING-type E3 ubiquitin transferase n=1 Tax=Tagetes erecta TaxID=13708 RepID=A0AAD8NWE2_TARER|nr:hypothetical protein QVD17_18815 [Tagetes erecta]
MLNAERNRRPNQPAANKGVNKNVVESLPKYAYDSNNEESGGKLSSGDCVICLVEYENGDEIRVLPECGHGFHVGCIDEWLECHSSCPSCRQVVVVTRCKKCGGVPANESGKVSLVVENEGGEQNEQNGGSVDGSD